MFRFWKKRVMLNIASESGYNIATALRGPDFFENDELKGVFTARIRWLVGLRDDDRDTGLKRERKVNESQARFALEQAKRFGENDSDAYRHYIEHIFHAATDLGDSNLAQLARLFLAYGNLPDVDTIIRLAGGE